MSEPHDVLNGELIIDEKLTSGEKRFVTHMVETMNYERSYKLAFPDLPPMRDQEIRAEAWELAMRPYIREEITARLPNTVEYSNFVRHLTLARVMDMIATDRNELTSYRIGACRHCWGVGHGYQWRDHEYVEALREAENTKGVRLPDIGGGFGFNRTREPHPSCPRCDGLGEGYTHFADTTKLSAKAMMLFGGVKQTRNGIEIIMPDQLKLIELAVRLSGGFDDEMFKPTNLTVNTMVNHVTTESMGKMTPEEAAQTYLRIVQKKLA